ncbi:hypothetical protein [Actinomadura opuntiae]|uniref:hypothetical protein n=1 Tax=Actinomadura sp. OS1-43 TaxID=604315 RepID=UPI00255AE508|nr:hypothetical protein [Actinomadura sp. OS1-43]MDL4821305.1 hypothetical protein [Actinomadura sp. OS1-43]
MISAQHETPIEIIRENPEVIPQLLKLAFGIEVSDDVTVRSASEACTHLAPTAYTADNVVEICEGGATEPTLAVVAETQRAVDPRKRHSWPVYLTTLHARADCPCYLVVICPRKSVADWARKPISIGHPGFDLAPLVVGPGTGPLVTTTAEAAEKPELTVLAALANVTPPDARTLEITHAALATIDGTDQKTAQLYTDMVLAVLPKAAQNILEDLVTTGTAEYKFKSEPFLRHYAEGEAKGEAKSVLKILAARGLTVSDEVRERVLGCQEESQLDDWLIRAGTVTSAEELFE